VSTLARYSENHYSDSVGLLRGSNFLYLTLLLIYIYIGKQINEKFRYYNFFLSLALYATFFLISCNDFGVIADRVFRLFNVVFPVILASIFIALSGKYRALTLVTAVLLLFFVSALLQRNEMVTFLT
jgi:hypothetical protein